MKELLKPKFNRLLIGLLIILSLGIALLVILNLQIKPHVTSVSQKGDSTLADTVGQQVVLAFNRPMQKDLVQTGLLISPDFKHELFWVGNQLYIVAKQALLADTNYSIQLPVSITDIYGTHLAAEFKYEFRTKQLQFAYIERAKDIGDTEKIILNSMNFDSPDKVFEATQIKSFGINSDYLAVATVEAELGKLTLVSLDDRSSKQINLGGDALVGDVQFSPINNEFLFLLQTVQKIGNSVIPQTGPQVYKYDIAKSQLSKVNISLNIQGVMEVIYTPDGKGMLLKSDDSSYYLLEFATGKVVSPFSQQAYATGGFNSDNTKILFLMPPDFNSGELNPRLIYVDNSQQVTQLVPGSEATTDPLFLSTSNSVVYARKYQEVIPTSGFYEVVLQDEAGNASVIAHAEGSSIEFPKPSPDDRFVSVEKYSLDDKSDFSRVRNFAGTIVKPYDAKLQFVDMLTRKLLAKEIDGVDLVWVK